MIDSRQPDKWVAIKSLVMGHLYALHPVDVQDRMQ